jgi:hypothetical protein
MRESKFQWVAPKPLVYFVGLSAKPNCEHLDSDTRTGSIVEQIICRLPTVQSVKTNLVKTPPLDNKGKLRYPNLHEMNLGWLELQKEICQAQPNLLVTLGQQVSFFLRSEMGIQPIKPQLPSDFSHQSYLLQSTSHILSVHHPSFVYVYRRKNIEEYVENVVRSVSMLIFESGNYHTKTWALPN